MNENNQGHNAIPGLSTISAKQKSYIHEVGIHEAMMADHGKLMRKFLLCGITSIIAAIVILAISDWWIVGIVFIVIGVICGVVFNMGRKGATAVKDSYNTAITKLEQNYGNADAAFKDMQSQFRPDWPVYKVADTDSLSMFTKDWYIHNNYRHYVKMADVAAIVGIMGEGTFIITVHGDVLKDMFGEKWGLLVDNVFLVSNPYILTEHDSSVLMPDGTETSLIEAYSANHIDAIIGTFLRKKQGSDIR